MARLKLPDFELAPQSSNDIEQEVTKLKKKIRNLYILNYISTAIIILMKFIF
jgi:hypothetical protein